MTNLLLLLTLPENVRRLYHQAITGAFPQLNVAALADIADVDPHLAATEILITFDIHLGNRAEAVLGAMPNLKWIQCLGSGVGRITETASFDPSVLLTNMRGNHGPAMSEAAMAAMLSLARNLPRIFRNQIAHKWERWPSRRLYGKTLGILGVGRIAEALAPRCKAFGMTVLGFTSAVRAVPDFDGVFSLEELPERAAALDYLVLLTPYSAATRNLVGDNILSALKPGACFVNLARGGIVDEAALERALRDGPLAAAALDVFATEPLPADSPFWDMENVVVMPHVGGFHDEYFAEVWPVLKSNIDAYLTGRPDDMSNIVPTR